MVEAVDLIWDRAPHAAFVDMVHWRGSLWCAFREGTGHVPGIDGVVRILRSDDGMNWQSAARIAEEGVDLRDPKLSVTPWSDLMVLIGGSVYRGGERVSMGPRVAFGSIDSSPELRFRMGEIQPVQLPEDLTTGQDWLWRVTWRETTAWEVVYQITDDGRRLQLVFSEDGRRYVHVAKLPVDPASIPNETTLRFLPDARMVAVVRREGAEKTGLIGHAAPPYREWSFAELPVKLGGPDLFVVPDSARVAGDHPVLLLASRAYDPGGARTMLGRVTLDGGFERLLTLPSGGDCSYPRLLPDPLDRRRLLCAYYSSHVGGRAAIHLATLRTARLLD